MTDTSGPTFAQRQLACRTCGSIDSIRCYRKEIVSAEYSVIGAVRWTGGSESLIPWQPDLGEQGREEIEDIIEERYWCSECGDENEDLMTVACFPEDWEPSEAMLERAARATAGPTQDDRAAMQKLD